MDSVENWRPIPGYPKHSVSDHGRAKSLGWKTRLPDGIMSLLIDKYGYPYLSIRMNETRGVFRRNTRVHTLVMLAFVGPCPEGMEICHNDGSRTNNHLSNLRYDTRQNNMRDAIRHGTCCLHPEYSEETRKEIIKQQAAGLHYRAIAHQLCISHTGVAKVIKSARQLAAATS